MGVNKVEANGETLIDLTEDSVTPEKLARGTTAHNSAGDQIEGTMPAPLQIADLTNTTWMLNTDIEAIDNANIYNIAFTSNGKEFEQFIIAANNLIYHDKVDSTDYDIVKDSYGWIDEAYRAVTFTGGDDVTNESLLAYITANGRIIVAESGGVGVDKITRIETSWGDTTSIDVDDAGVYWEQTFNIDHDGGLVEGDYAQKIPLAAGDNVTFEVDEENQVVKIHAEGGGSGEGVDSIVGIYNEASPNYLSFDEYALYYSAELEIETESADGSNNYHYPILHNSIPLAAGNNVAFEVDEGSGRFQIHAGVKYYDDYYLGTWLLNEVITPPPNNGIEMAFVSNGKRYNGIVKSDMLYYSKDMTDSGANGVFDFTGIDCGENVWVDEICRTITVLDHYNNEDVLGWLDENGAKVNSLIIPEMPQIRFVSMIGDGWYGQIPDPDDGTYSYHNMKFVIEIAKGTVQIGDTLQLCGMKCFGAVRVGGEIVKPPKRKLRKVAEYEITEYDIGKRFITFGIPFDNQKALRLFTRSEFSTTGAISPMYFRIRRPKGKLNSGTLDGITVDAEFSNVVTVMKTSHVESWVDEYGGEYKYCKLTIV